MSAFIKRMRREIYNAGVEIPEGTSLYRPGGYPIIGLSPLSTELSTRSGALLEKQLLRAEHKRGNTSFTTTGLPEINPKLGNEMVSVYLGLAERFRGVVVEGIDFYSNLAGYFTDTTGGITFAFAIEFPHLYAVAQDLGTSDVHEVLIAIHGGVYDRNTTARVNRELAKAGRSVLSRNPLSHGFIQMGNRLSNPKTTAVLHAYLETRNISRARRGEPLTWPPTYVSFVSTILVHEFGHAVEQAVVDQGPDSWEHVIRALEGCILRKANGRWRISDRQLRAAGLTRSDARLINYPSHYDSSNAGNGEWRKAVRDLVGKEMSREIGAYSGDWLSECFAEAFMQSIASSVPSTRQQLAPFQEALYDVGLSVKRRRNV
jgi:hypothetical protein